MVCLPSISGRPAVCSYVTGVDLAVDGGRNELNRRDCVEHKC
jgi:hypothetical protein